MPYVKAPLITRLTLPSNKEYWVDWRESILYGDMKAATKAAVQLDMETGESRTDPTAMTDALLLGHIVAWNLDDEEGNLLPLTPESLDKLESRDTELLLSRASDGTRREEKRRKN